MQPLIRASNITMKVHRKCWRSPRTTGVDFDLQQEYSFFWSAWMQAWNLTATPACHIIFYDGLVIFMPFILHFKKNVKCQFFFNL